MAQINLLKQKSPSRDVWRILTSLTAKLLIAFLLGVVAYYGWLYFKSGQTQKDIAATQQKIAEGKKKVAEMKGRDEVLTRQMQVKELESVMNNHLYWSGVLPELARATLKKANYSRIKASSDGTIAMSVSLPTLEDLDKFMQVFNLPQFNEKLSEVRVGSFHRIPDDEKPAVNFDVKMKFVSTLLQQSTGAQ